MRGRGVLLVLFALIALGSTTKCPKKRSSPAREILCYTSTFDVQLLAESVCSCTTLVHQDHDVRNLSVSDIIDLRKALREMHPPLQFTISIHDIARTLRTSATSRQEAIARIIAVMKEVDGVELNVTAGSKERLYNFVKSLRDEMVRKSYDKRIFLALPSKSEDLAKQFDLKELVKYVDLFTLSTHYLTDEDSAFVTFHPSRLIGLFDMLNTDSLVDLIIGLGAPKQKILVSLPADAYKFTLNDEDENASRSQTKERDPIPIDRKQLCEAISTGDWTVERDEDLTAPYAFQNKTWISFEDKISVGIKGKYALLRDLAGLAVRNIESDVKTECERPIAQEIYQTFTELKRKSRHAVLNALEDEIRQAQFSYPRQAKTSNFRVARVVDSEGHIRAVRENTQTEFVCRRQGYFVHPKSCNRFYRCVKFNQEVENYSVFEFDCPAGLSFDERTEVCVWPGSLPQGSPCPGSSEIAPVAPKRFECPSKPGYYADPQNCRWFFACVDLGGPELMAFEFRCPYGLVFDETKLVCEWPWLVPACSDGSVYTRTEYNYGGFTAGASTGVGVGGYVTGSLPEYAIRVGADYSDGQYSRATDTDILRTNRPTYGLHAGHAGGHTGVSASDAGVVGGHVGLSGQSGVGYTQSAGRYGGVPSISTFAGSSDAHVTGSSGANIAGGNTGYPISSGGGAGGAGHVAGSIGYSGGLNTGYTVSHGATAGLPQSTAGGYFGGASGGHGVTTEDKTYSGVSGSNYFGSTAREHTDGVSGSNALTGGGAAGGGGYSTISGSSYVGAAGSLGSSTDSNVGLTGSVHVGSTHTAGAGSLTTGGYSASGGVYSGTTGYQSPSGVPSQSFGTVSGSSYPGATNGVGIAGGSINSGYAGSTTDAYRGSTATGSFGQADVGYTQSSGQYGSLPSVSTHAGSPAGVHAIGSTGTSAAAGGSTGYSISKGTGEIGVGSIGIDTNLPIAPGVESHLHGTVSSGHISGTNFISGVSRPPTPTISVNLGHAGGSHYAGGSAGATSTGIRYNEGDEGYTVPVFVQPQAPIYPSVGTTAAGIRGHAGITEAGNNVRVTSGYAQSDFTRSSLNVSISGNVIPTGYDGIRGGTATGGILTGSSVEGSIRTDDTLSGTIISHGSTPGAISAGSIDQGVVISGGAQNGYVTTSSGTPGYVIENGVKTVAVGAVTPGTSVYGPPTPPISISGPSTSGVFVKGDSAPGVTVSGQTAPGVSVGGSIYPGTVVSSTGGPKYVSQTGTVYHDASNTLIGGLTPPRSPGYQTDSGRGEVAFGVTYDTGKYLEKDIPDYRPTSATLPESVVSGSRIGSTGSVTFGSAVAGVQGSTTAAPGYSAIPSVFTPSGFTKTGPTKTGITTALLGGGGSYSVSTSERRPIPNPENIGEKAFEGNVAGHTRPSSANSGIGLSPTLTPPAYSSASGSRVTLQSDVPGYSYPRPTVQFETGSGTFSSKPISPDEGKLPVTTATSFLSVEMHHGSLDRDSYGYGSRIPTVPIDRGSSTSTMRPIIYTESPGIYKTTQFESAKIPDFVSTPRPVIDTGYKTIITPTRVPISVTTDQFSQHAGSSTSGIGTGVSIQRTDLSTKGYGIGSPSPSLEYLPGKSTISGVTSTDVRYDAPTISTTGQLGVTYKKPSTGVAYESPSSVISPTTFRPSETHYSGQGLSPASPSETVFRGGSPTNLDIPRDEIDKLITNYDRGTVKYTPSMYDTFTSSVYGSTSAKPISPSWTPTKSSSSVKTDSFALTTHFGSTSSSYEVTTKPSESRGKVIVKWSDLHPLLLGKLGADCTCKADPFANLRGPGKKQLIASSRGNVDLANYDESEIYVDLGNDRSSEEKDYGAYDNYPHLPFKVGPLETTSVAAVTSNLPSSSYLPVSPTVRNFDPAVGISGGVASANGDASSRFQGGLRVGKKLKDVDPSPNSLTYDEGEEEEEDDPDQIIDGVTDCARPGLFRHPNLCNKFYACYWDQWKKKFTLHIFNCPIHLTFDSSAGACNWPSKGPACQANNLLV